MRKEFAFLLAFNLASLMDHLVNLFWPGGRKTGELTAVPVQIREKGPLEQKQDH
jgi:hypothetical protein